MTTNEPPSPSQARDFATQVVMRLRAAGHEALFAGGCVRDLLLGRQPTDYDVATTARPEQVRQVFGHRRTRPVGVSFGVVLVVGRPEEGTVEVATFRKEGPYGDGRRPDHIEYCTPEEDARRRDFTINGMFFDPQTSEVRDYVGGQADLQARLLRAIGRPEDRMEEDKLRLLRAVRFAATLDFAIEPSTFAAVQQRAATVLVVSAERIAQEFRKMLVHRFKHRAAELCEQTGLLRVLIPELETSGDAWPRTLAGLARLRTAEFATSLAMLLMTLPGPAEIGAVCRRWKLSNAEHDHCLWLLSHKHALDDAPRLSLAKLKRLLAHPLAPELLELTRARHAAWQLSPEATEFCDRFLTVTPPEQLNPPPLLTGNELIRSGLKPGPAFKDLLEQLRDEQLENRLQTRDEALAWVRRLQVADSDATP